MPYLKMRIIFENQHYDFYTDEDGGYSIDVSGFDFTDGKAKKAYYQVWLEYVRDGVNYFHVADAGGNKMPVVIKHIRSLKSESDGNYDFQFIRPVEPYTGSLDEGMLPHFSLIYANIHHAVDFCLKELKANINYKLPVKVHVMGDDGTKYDPNNAIIHIDARDSQIGAPDQPDNREYHEFMHHLMMSEYGNWPAGRCLAGTENHDGYINPSTADSYMEGFAEFMALLVSEHAGEEDVSDYSGFGSLDRNYKMWSYQGSYEEFVIAGILWDLYDSENEKYDNVTLSLQDMWAVLKHRYTDWHDYYKVFANKHPEKFRDIAMIFILHGAFNDQAPGDGQYTIGEPFKNVGDNKSYNAGEYYIDMHYPPNYTFPHLLYSQGETIGQATNYVRENRSKAVRLGNAFLKVVERGPRFYQIDIKYSGGERHADSETVVVQELDGKIFFNPPPEQVGWNVEIKPYSYDYTSSKPYQISREEFLKKYYASTGSDSFDTHDFQLVKTGASRDPAPQNMGGVTPKYTLNAQDELTLPINPPEKNQPQNPGIPCIPLPLILGIAGTLLMKK